MNFELNKFIKTVSFESNSEVKIFCHKGETDLATSSLPGALPVLHKRKRISRWPGLRAFCTTELDVLIYALWLLF